MGEAGHDHLNKLENKEHIFLDDTAERVDIKDNIKIEETDIYDGSNYLNNENFLKIKLEHGELSTNVNCDEYKREQLDEPSNTIYKVLSDEQWNGNGEQVPTSNTKESPVDKKMIETEETNFFEGATYLKYENCDIKTEPAHSILDNCNECKSEREVEENKDSICVDDDFSNQETLDGERLNQNEFSDKLAESERQPTINELIVKTVPGKRVQCRICDTTTTTRGSMKKHIEVVHFGLRNHKCEYCDYAAGRPSVLKYHINSVHHKIRNYKCQYCDYAANQLRDLKTHINAVHRKVKNRKCEHCDYTASRASALKKHINIVHHKLKNLKCEFCDYTAGQTSNLKNHISVVHLKINHNCEYCDYTATRIGSLKYHISSVHLNIRNHKCQYCDYAAVHLGHLKTHINAVHLKIKK